MTVRLHGYWRSTPSWRVRIALAWKGVAYETAPVNLLKGEQRSDAYLSVNPQGRLPALEIDGAVLVQAPAILEYLEETRPQPPLLPADPVARARVRAMCALIACDVAPLQNLGVGQALQSRFDADEAQVKAWRRDFVTDGLGVLEAWVARDGGRFCVGDGFSLADLHLVTQLYGARRFGVDLEPLAHLRRVEAEALALPAVHDTRPEAQPDAAATA